MRGRRTSAKAYEYSNRVWYFQWKRFFLAAFSNSLLFERAEFKCKNVLEKPPKDFARWEVKSVFLFSPFSGEICDKFVGVVLHHAPVVLRGVGAGVLMLL